MDRNWRPAFHILAESIPGNTSFKIDYDKILENIEDLNAVAGEGIGQIKHTVDGARLKVSHILTLILLPLFIFCSLTPQTQFKVFYFVIYLY